MQNGFLHLSSAEEYGVHSVNKKSVCSPLSWECLNDSSKNRCEGFLETFGHVLICAWDVNGQKVSGSFWQRYPSKAGSSQLAEERHSWVMHCFCQQHQSVVLRICFLTAPSEQMSLWTTKHCQLPWAQVAVAAGKLRGSGLVSLWVGPYCCSLLLCLSACGGCGGDGAK